MVIESKLILDEKDIFEAIRLLLATKGMSAESVCSYSMDTDGRERRIIVVLSDKDA